MTTITELQKENTTKFPTLTDEEKETITNLLQQLSEMLFEFWVKKKTKIDEIE